jgi:hypothetical protein
MSATAAECVRQVRRWRMVRGELVFIGTCTAPAPPVEREGEREDDREGRESA